MPSGGPPVPVNEKVDDTVPSSPHTACGSANGAFASSLTLVLNSSRKLSARIGGLVGNASSLATAKLFCSSRLFSPTMSTNCVVTTARTLVDGGSSPSGTMRTYAPERVQLLSSETLTPDSGVHAPVLFWNSQRSRVGLMLLELGLTAWLKPTTSATCVSGSESLLSGRLNGGTSVS